MSGHLLRQTKPVLNLVHGSPSRGENSVVECYYEHKSTCSGHLLGTGRRPLMGFKAAEGPGPRLVNAYEKRFGTRPYTVTTVDNSACEAKSHTAKAEGGWNGHRVELDKLAEGEWLCLIRAHCLALSLMTPIIGDAGLMSDFRCLDPVPQSQKTSH